MGRRGGEAKAMFRGLGRVTMPPRKKASSLILIVGVAGMLISRTWVSTLSPLGRWAGQEQFGVVLLWGLGERRDASCTLRESLWTWCLAWVRRLPFKLAPGGGREVRAAKGRVTVGAGRDGRCKGIHLGAVAVQGGLRRPCGHISCGEPKAG
jgi:hypothetical protein